METIPTKTILSGYADTAWFGANYNMNLYKGCCHGCIYCDSRSGSCSPSGAAASCTPAL